MYKTKGYSLWALPTGKLAGECRSIIKTLSQKHHTPSFEPHVTVLGELEMPEDEFVEKAAKLASKLSPYTISVEGIRSFPTYFRFLVIALKKTPEVMGVYRKAEALFGVKQSSYFPHLSVMYGTMYTVLKENLAPTITLPTKSCTVKRLAVYSTNGSPTEWFKVKELPLSP